MKKIVVILIILICFISFELAPLAESDEDLYFESLTTLNFKDRKDLDYNSIKKICSYDFCDYRSGDNLQEAIEHFTMNYLKTIPDEETRSILSIKGIRITKIVLLN